MAERGSDTGERVKRAYEYALQLGSVAVEMAAIKRATYNFPGRHENDAEHSFHLSITAAELAAELYPELDSGLVAEFGNVHDSVEIVVGDIASHNLNKKQREQKTQMEHEALPQLYERLPPHTRELVERYEAQEEPEARFTYLVDKLLVSIMHVVATEANEEEFIRRYKDKKDGEHLAQLSAARTRELKEKYPEFDVIHMLKSLAASVARKKLIEVGRLEA